MIKLSNIFIIWIIVWVTPMKTQSNDTTKIVENITSSFKDCNGNECQNKELVCQFKGGSCQIYCNDERSCENTTIRMTTGSYLNIYCQANMSCINAQITEAGTVTAYGENTLNGASIQCLEGKGCSISCKDSLSCSNSIIDGTQSVLSINCDKYQSCLDMTVYCPAGAMNRAYCTITGNEGNQITIHNEFNIYAPNGWGDIQFIDYTAYTLSGKLYCAGNDSFLIDGSQQSCDIQYGIWDCKDITSPCRDQYWLTQDRETYICDGVDGQNLCNDQEIICSEPTESQPLQIPACNLLCIGNDTCQNLRFQCNPEKKCDVVCAGDNSCNGLVVRGNSRNSGGRSHFYPMNIICGKNGNNAACQNSNFSAPFSVGYLYQLNINAFGTNNLRGTEIYAPQLYGNPLHLQCNFNQSCQGGMSLFGLLSLFFLW